jgi:hypothetical protein
MYPSRVLVVRMGREREDPDGGWGDEPSSGCTTDDWLHGGWGACGDLDQPRSLICQYYRVLLAVAGYKC